MLTLAAQRRWMNKWTSLGHRNWSWRPSELFVGSCSVWMMNAQHHPVSFKLSHHAGSVKVFGILRLPVQSQEGVSIARCTVTQPVALLQQTVVPNHLPALQGVIQVLLHAESLGWGKNTRGVEGGGIMFSVLWFKTTKTGVISWDNLVENQVYFKNTRQKHLPSRFKTLSGLHGPHYRAVSANNRGRWRKYWCVESKNAPSTGYIHIKSIFTSLPLTPHKRA